MQNLKNYEKFRTLKKYKKKFSKFKLKIRISGVKINTDQV